MMGKTESYLIFNVLILTILQILSKVTPGHSAFLIFEGADIFILDLFRP